VNVYVDAELGSSSHVGLPSAHFDDWIEIYGTRIREKFRSRAIESGFAGYSPVFRQGSGGFIANQLA
jgi:hypothetical protein